MSISKHWRKLAALSFTVALALAGVVALLWLLGGSQVALAQAGTGVIRVATTGSDTPGCGGVANPCQTVQYAVDQAQAGVDEIRVASGLYTGVQGRPAPVGYLGPTVITQVVYISKTVTIRGGYTTAFTGPPDPEANPTTLDAQGQGRVLFITGDISPTVEGLRITGGDAAGLGSVWGADVGGGVYVINATVTISNNQMFSSTAYYGGGLYLHDSDATLSGNTVISNTADQRGGGLYLWSSDATLSGNTVISNTATWLGGGLFLQFSDATLSGNTVISNTANNGGGLYLDRSDATLSGNTVTANTAGLRGGGLNLWDSAATLINNVVADNQANTAGSGLYVGGASPHLLHTTIAHNSGGDGIGVYVTNEGSNYSTVALTNTIIVSHSVGITVTAGNTATLESTLWHGNTADWGGAGTIVTGTHNYWGDPLFEADGYHLLDGSAAIDRGVDAGVTTDIDGDSRPQGSAPDLGADEFVPAPSGDNYLPIIMKNAS